MEWLEEARRALVSLSMHARECESAYLSLVLHCHLRVFFALKFILFKGFLGPFCFFFSTCKYSAASRSTPAFNIRPARAVECVEKRRMH